SAGCWRGPTYAGRYFPGNQHPGRQRRLDLQRHAGTGHSGPDPAIHQRQLASLVDNVSRIEATSYESVGVEKIYLREGADVSQAISQVASSALVVLKYLPPNIT